MLLYFDGFDMHTRVLDSLDVGGGSMQDGGRYWRGGTITLYDFEEGYEVGNAMKITSSGINSAGKIPTGQEARWGFWAKFNPNASFDMSQFTRPGLIIRFGNTAGGAAYISSVADGIIGSTAAGILTDQWAYYEFYANVVTGVFQFSRNGSLLINGTGTPDLSAGTWGVKFGNDTLSSAPQFLVDHLWITDGAFPEGTDILGVQVVGAADGYEGDDGFKGSLVIGGAQYQTETARPVISSQLPYAAGRNLVNVINYPFAVNPATGLPWDSASFSSIEQWGLCYGQLGSAPGKIRLAGVVFAYLDYNEGRPLVRNLKATSAAAFSGPWTKSNESLSYAAHVNTYPRPDTYLEEDALSLYIDGEGCLLFNLNVELPDEPVISQTGITFAEEFRTDYTDWVRVDGAGVNYDSSFVSGYGIYGEGNRKFQSNYITLNFENVFQGGAYIQGLWDYSVDPDTGRWSMRQNVYKQTDGFKHGTRRLKIRGHGKTLQLRVSSQAGKPFKINGWTILITSNTNV